ncbi:hypothetical protein QFC20_002472 [Naganishia adeliensis]|uniref:Uncharacterized protein n=1 Tax=Naganishia adeliensis TaxID=92952 RepID=A0ACC2WL52_9TREE|nr:hypothetical protein QFC20_002472 [Naganishia adeliensis]
MATAVTILRPMADNSTTICPTCRQPLRTDDARHGAFSPESLPSIPLLPSINESTSPELKRSTLQVDTSVGGNHAAQLPSPHTVGEGKAKARARGWSMVNEDAAKAQRELTWNQYRKLVAELEVREGREDEVDPVNLLKDTLLKVLHEAEQLSNEHYSLQQNEKELEMNLKIARSNLQLAEMNSEMLEEALRRGGEGFAGRMQPLPIHGSGKTSIDSARTEQSQPAMPSLATAPRTSTDSTAKSTGARSTSMTIPIPGGASAAMRPTGIRRRSGSEGGSAVGSSTAQTNKPGASTPIPPSTRPTMERSSTMGAGQVAASTSAGSGFGSFFRKNIDKHGPGIMKDLGLQNLKMPDLQNLPIPSPSAATRAEFFSSLGMSNAGAASSSPNLAGGFSSSPTTSQAGGVPRSPMVRPHRGGWYDAAADMGGSSDAELQKLRASLVVTNKSVVTLKDELGAMKKAKAELEAELETLSQALFEEANKMVADERKKRAEKEDEAREAIEEREALRKLVKLMEAEKAQAAASGVESGKEARNHVSEGPDVTEQEGPIPGGFPAGDSQITDVNASEPSPSREEDLAELLKRMEADFGPLPHS